MRPAEAAIYLVTATVTFLAFLLIGHWMVTNPHTNRWSRATDDDKRPHQGAMKVQCSVCGTSLYWRSVWIDTWAKGRPLYCDDCRNKVDRDDPGYNEDEFQEISRLLLAHPFQFASSMPDTPHEYTKKPKWENEADFERVVEFIRQYGYRSKYAGNWYIQLDVGEHFYWTMGMPLYRTTIINRKGLDPNWLPTGYYNHKQHTF